jgi:DNA anti-recombination protein RmuC
MATSEYRFTQSAQILRELARTTPRPPPPPLVTGSSEHTENVKPFEFIDESLSLLGHLQKAQDSLIRREFEQQRDLITDKFGREQYDAGQRDQTIYQNFTKIQGQLENFKQNVRQRFEEVGQRFEEVGQRFEEVGQRFEEVGQRFDRVETELDNFREEVGQRFDEMQARMFNALSYRPHHQIHPVALLKNRRLQKPDVKSFPTDIRKFWKLQARENGRSNSSDRLCDFSLTLAQLLSGSICFNSTPLRDTKTGIQRMQLVPTL